MHIANQKIKRGYYYYAEEERPLDDGSCPCAPKRDVAAILVDIAILGERAVLEPTSQ